MALLVDLRIGNGRSACQKVEVTPLIGLLDVLRIQTTIAARILWLRHTVFCPPFIEVILADKHIEGTGFDVQFDQITRPQ